MMTEPESISPETQPTATTLWPWAPWGLALVLLAVGFSIWEPFPPGVWHDDGVYVLLGRSLAEGDGLRYMGIPGAPLAPKFPPLFPLFLSLIWLLFPSFPENVPLLGGLNLVVTALAAGVFSTYLRKALKFPAPLALSVTALIWISAHLWRVASVPLSEPIFLFFLLLALWAGGRMEAKKGIGPVVLFLLVGGCAFYARTLGIAVLVAGVATLLLSRRGKAALWTGLGTLALLLPWLYWTRRAADSIPDPLLDTLGPYGGWLAGQLLHHPLDFAFFVMANTGQLLGQTIILLVPGFSRPPLLLGLVVVPVLLLGLRELFERSRILPLTLCLSLGILLIWPFQETRLLVPLQPILMLSVAVGFGRLVYSMSLPAGLRIPTAVVALGWVILFASVSIFRLSSGWSVEPYRIRSAALMDAVRAVAEKTPPDAVVGAPELWPGIHLYTGRSVVPSARFLPLAGGEPVEGTPEQQYEIWIGSGVTHILVEHGGRVHGAALDRVDALCPAGTVQVLDSQPGQFLVALLWDSACQERVLQAGTGAGDGD
jgi:hypothetical protein